MTIAHEITNTGNAVLSMPTPKPWMRTGAGPVRDLSAMDCVGAYV